jgi:hypothetical protein
MAFVVMVAWGGDRAGLTADKQPAGTFHDNAQTTPDTTTPDSQDLAKHCRKHASRGEFAWRNDRYRKIGGRCGQLQGMAGL